MSQTRQEECERICITVDSIKLLMLVGVWDSSQYRLKTCPVANGSSLVGVLKKYFIIFHQYLLNIKVKKIV